MARDFSTVEIEFNNAKKQFDNFKVSPNADGSYTVGRTQYTAAQFGDMRRRAENRFKKLEKEFKSVKSTQKDALPKAEQEVIDLSDRLARGLRSKQGRRITQADIDAANNRVARLRQQVGTSAPFDSTEPATAQTSTQQGATGPVQGPFLTAAGEEGLNAAAAAIANRTGTGTGGGTNGTGTGTGRGGRTPKPKLPKNWEAKFREMFPAQSWLLDIDRSKYSGLYKLIQRGVIDRMWETPESQARFAAELNNTDFFSELKTKDVVRNVKAVVGDLGFDSVPFNKFLTTAMNFGWEGDVLKSEVYKEAFRKDDSGNFANPTAVTRAKASTDYKKAQGFGRAFFSTVSDSTIEQRLTGVITDEDLIRQQRELAKTRYGHLGNLIDQGLTLEDIAGSFQQKAAQVLERDINDIDMGTADFESAFNFGEEGKKRMMSSGEWEIMLRSDAKYGWDKTENAKQEARGLAASIAQAFGKVI